MNFWIKFHAMEMMDKLKFAPLQVPHSWINKDGLYYLML